jgi:hypothetical protein
MTYNELRTQSGSVANGLYHQEDASIDLSRVHRRYDTLASRSSMRTRQGTLAHEAGHHWFETKAESLPDVIKGSADDLRTALWRLGRERGWAVLGAVQANESEFAARAVQAFVTEAPLLALKDRELYDAIESIFTHELSTGSPGQ